MKELFRTGMCIQTESRAVAAKGLEEWEDEVRS